MPSSPRTSQHRPGVARHGRLAPSGEHRLRTCPLCEATCGLELDARRRRGRSRDPRRRRRRLQPRLHLPEGRRAQGSSHEDPDRLRTPLVAPRRRASSRRRWDEAFAEIDARLPPILERARPRRGRGLPRQPERAQPRGAALRPRAAARRSARSNVFSREHRRPDAEAGRRRADVRRRRSSIPVPDVDRTDYLLMLGANPLASNGSLMTAPDMRGRLRAHPRARRQGRRGRSAPHRDRRGRRRAPLHPPGHRRAASCSRSSHVLFAEGLVDLGAARRARATGSTRSRALVAPTSRPRRVARGVRHRRRRRSAASRASSPRAERAAVYGRIGTCTQEFGTLASWLVDVLNVLTGNLDRPGGAMFTQAAAGAAEHARRRRARAAASRSGAGSSRVRGLPEVFGELPVACLAEEIETPGEGQVRALITIAGNPALSTPNAGRLDARARRRSTSWSASTSTSTRRRATPT